MTKTGKPNVLLIMTDQQRADSLGCYGNTTISTPFLDHLSAQGVRFVNAGGGHLPAGGVQPAYAASAHSIARTAPPGVCIRR